MTSDFNIEIEYKHVPRLDSGSDESIKYLDEYGYVIIKNALTSMSAGMSIALFTTLSGLIGGLLLKMQYYFLEDASEKLFYLTS